MAKNDRLPANILREPGHMKFNMPKLSLYEHKIVLKLVQMAQDWITKKVMPHTKIEPVCDDITKVTLSAAEVYENFNDNYANVKKSLITLSQKQLPPYEDEEVWKAVPFVAFPLISKRSGNISFFVGKETWEYLLTFGRNYTQYDYNISVRLKSTYSILMYKYCSNQKTWARNPQGVTVKISELRKILGVEDKYPNTRDFLKRTIEIAKAELDSCSPWTFEWGYPIGAKKGRGGRIQEIWIKPKEQPQFYDKETLRRTQTSKLTSRNALDIVNPELYEWLRKTLKWPAASITANKQNIVKAQETIPDLYDRFPIWVDRWERQHAKNPAKYPDQIAYVIGAMNDEVRQINGEKSISRPPIQKSIFDELPY